MFSVPGGDGVRDGDDDMDDGVLKLRHVDGRELTDPIAWKGGLREHRGHQASLRAVLPKLTKKEHFNHLTFEVIQIIRDTFGHFSDLRHVDLNLLLTVIVM